MVRRAFHTSIAWIPAFAGTDELAGKSLPWIGVRDRLSYECPLPNWHPYF